MAAAQRQETLTVIEPATEQVLRELPRAGAEDVDRAVARARAAFPAWRAVAPGGAGAPGARGGLLRGVATVLGEPHEELSVLEARTAGKPIASARGEIA